MASPGSRIVRLLLEAGDDVLSQVGRFIVIQPIQTVATTRTVDIDLKDILGNAAGSAVCTFSPITANIAQGNQTVIIGSPQRVTMTSDGTAQTTLAVPETEAYKYQCEIRDVNDRVANRFQFTLADGTATTLAAIMADANVVGEVDNTSLEAALQDILPTTEIAAINITGTATIQELVVSGTATLANVSYDSTQDITTSGTITGTALVTGGTVTALEFRDTDNTVTGIKAQAIGGTANIASGNYSKASGLQSKAELLGASAHSAGQFSTAGDAQNILLIARREITGSSTQDLYLDGTSTVLAIPNNTVWSVFVEGMAVVKESGTGGPTQGACCSHLIHGIISNVGGTVTLVDQTEIDKIPGGATGNMELAASDANNALRITFDPPNQAAADTVMRVVASVFITQGGF